MLTHSVAVDVWDVCPKAWLRFRQRHLAAWQISHGGPAVSTHSQPERRIAIIRQEEANPMKTLASVLTLLVGIKKMANQALKIKI